MTFDSKYLETKVFIKAAVELFKTSLIIVFRILFCPGQHTPYSPLMNLTTIIVNSAVISGYMLSCIRTTIPI